MEGKQRWRRWYVYWVWMVLSKKKKKSFLQLKMQWNLFLTVFSISAATGWTYFTIIVPE